MIRVLVVDDEPQLMRALRINLSARGYEVVVAADGASALEAAARHMPDLVILDLGLPDMDGTQVIVGLRGWTKIPILVLSGRTDAADKVDALDAGADDYVTKPFSMEELLARLRALQRRAEADADALRAQLLDTPHSLLPVCRSSLDAVLGVGRGTDLLLYMLVVVFAFFSLNTYLRFKDTERRLTKLARAMAIRDAVAPPVRALEQDEPEAIVEQDVLAR